MSALSALQTVPAPASSKSSSSSAARSAPEISISDLPIEVLQLVFESHMPLAKLWRLRRVSRGWKRMAEDSFAMKLRTVHGGQRQGHSKGAALFTFTFVLLSSRGGPWFHVPRRLTSPVYDADHGGVERQGLDVGTGGPSLQADGVEDVKVVRMRCGTADAESSTLTLVPDQDDLAAFAAWPSGSDGGDKDGGDAWMKDTVTLYRCPSLERHEWIVKGLMRCDTTLDLSGARRVDPLVAAGPFTLVSTEMELTGPGSTRSSHGRESTGSNTLTSFEMIMKYSVKDNRSDAGDSDNSQNNANGAGINETSSQGSSQSMTTQTPPLSYLTLRLDSLKISYSHLFAAMCSSPLPLQSTSNRRPHVPVQAVNTNLRIAPPLQSPRAPFRSMPIPEEARISVFPKNSVDLLRRRAAEAGLSWSSSYWSFDVVLHWLATSGSCQGSCMISKPEAACGGHGCGTGKSADDVVRYLVEYEAVVEESRRNRKQARTALTRFYSL